SGQGVNLTQAVASAGRITFDCGGPATIAITGGHKVVGTIDIDGGGIITLDGGGSHRMFIGENANISLRNISIQNGHVGENLPDSNPDAGPRFGSVVSVFGLGSRVALRRVTIRNSDGTPISLSGGHLIVEESQYSKDKV